MATVSEADLVAEASRTKSLQRWNSEIQMALAPIASLFIIGGNIERSALLTGIGLGLVAIATLQHRPEAVFENRLGYLQDQLRFRNYLRSLDGMPPGAI